MAETAVADLGPKVRREAQAGALSVRYRTDVQQELTSAGVEDVDVNNIFRTGSYGQAVSISGLEGTERLRLSGRLDDSTPIEFEVEVFEADDGEGNPKKLNARITKVMWPLGRPESRKERARRLEIKIVKKRRRP